MAELLKLDSPQPGMLCHVDGWNKGCVFRIVEIDERGMATLITPKTRRKYVVPASRLMMTRLDEARKENERQRLL